MPVPAVAMCPGSSTRTGYNRAVRISAVTVALLSIAGAAAAQPPPAKPRPAPPSTSGHDFIAEARLLYRVAACGGTGALPPELAADQAVVDKHCEAIAPYMDKFREQYFVTARAWFKDHAPKDLPSTVVYPFGGGDLLSALVAFPDATEITTLSLELSGDPRKLPALTPAELDRDLAAFRREIGALIWVGSNSSLNLSAQQRNFLPGQVSSFLLGLATGGYEPLAMRFFAIEDGGSLRYLDKAEIEADTKHTKSLRGNWKSPSFAASFRNVEITYRKIGETTVRVHRHIAWNLDNDTLKKDPRVLRHLEAKGKVAILVKGASYLLWLGDFSTMRGYILDHLAWMLSDSTGVPPTYARPAGMVQEAYGRFAAPILVQVEGRREDLDTRALWRAPKGPMPFRFGYLDKVGNKHVLITRPK